MEEVQARHRKEQRDLQSRVTAKKKQATKKNRKAVNDECEKLEADLKQKQAGEIAALNGGGQEQDGAAAAAEGGNDLPSEELEALTLKVDGEEENEKENNDIQPAKKEHARQQQPVAEESPTTATGTTTPAKKRNRQKDRLARRAAEQDHLTRQAEEEAAHLPDLKEQERTRMLEAMKSHHLLEKEIRADGHCLYSAVADQLSHLQIPLLDHPSPSDEKSPPAYKAVRAHAASYISTHPDDFLPFLEEPLPSYLHKIRDTGEWGGQLELLALARTYGVDINVLQDFGRVEKIEAGNHGGHDDDDEDKNVNTGGVAKAMWLGYYKHNFGLGEHYNSLRKIP